jgi:type II secretory pathway component PulJ
MSTAASASMRARRGYSLIELLVAITAGTAVMAVAVSLLAMLLGVDGQVRRRSLARAALDRLADQFRRDVHAALDLKPVDNPPADPAQEWQLQLPSDRTVRYRLRAGEVQRIEQAGGKPQAVESYAIHPDAGAAIQVDRDSRPPTVSLRFTQESPRPVARATLALEIDAVLGSDRREAEK